MELYKTIIQGRLEFGREKSYDTVLKQFQMRAETHFKNELIIKEEEIFFKDELAIIIPRQVGQASEKWFKNSMGLLSYCSQFAVAGALSAWMTNQGKILHYFPIEPDSEKIVVQSYLKGKSLVKTKGKQEEALEALTKAIEKYEKHSQAYERRAKVNFILKNYHEALRDYNKSIGIYQSNPHAFFGRAKVHMINKDFELAKEDFEQALKTSVALQPLYWKCRRRKGKLHKQLGEWDKAVFDLKLYCNRKFTKEDTNYKWLRSCSYDHGLVLMEMEQFGDAVKVFNTTLEFELGPDKITDDIVLLRRGIAKKSGRIKKYLDDIKESATQGNKEAKKWLKDNGK